MPVNCCIPRCKSSRDLHLPDLKLSFHKLPSRIEDKQQWVEIIRKTCNYEVKKSSYVCSLHFEPDCFQYGGLCVNRMLKKGSVPTKFFSVVTPDEVKIEKKKKVDVNNVNTMILSTEENPKRKIHDIKIEKNVNTLVLYPEQKPQRVPLESTELNIQNSSRVCNCRIDQSHFDKGTQTEEYKVNFHDKPSLINMNRMHLINLDLAQIDCSAQVKNLLQRAKKEIIDNRRRIRTLQMNKYRLLKRVKSYKLLLKNSRKKDSMTIAVSSALDHCYSSKRKE